MSTQTSSYLANPEFGVSHGIREFLLRCGTATAVEIRRGIARDLESARFIVTEVCVALARMTKSGVLSRTGKVYALEQFKNQRKPRDWTPAGKRVARINVDVVIELSYRVRADFRSELMSELYLLLATGEYKPEEKERLFADAKKSVIKANCGDIYKPQSLNKSLNDHGSTLLDILSSENTRDESYLTSTEEGASHE